jgi:acetyl esterase
MASSAQPFHPEAQAFVDRLVQMNAKSYNELGSIEAARERSRLVSVGLAGTIDYDGTTVEMVVPVAPDSPEGLPVYVYKPRQVLASQSDPPILVYYHGGGLVVGTRANVETACQILSAGAGCIVVNVEYRLAPEHRFPVPIEDGCTVARWVLENRIKIGGGAKSKVGVAGDSGGGTIAASVSHDVPGLAFQILVYPRVTTLGEGSLKSYSEYSKGPVLTAPLVEWFERMCADPCDYADPRMATINRTRFDHLPPTLFVVAECDMIRDDSYEYAKKLTAAGVYNELYLAKGAIHAFFTIPGAFPELCRAAHAKTIEFIKKWGA